MNNIVFPKKKILILGGAFAEIKKFRLSLIRSMVAADFDVYVLSFNYTGLDKELIVKEGATPVEYNQIRGSINPVKIICIYQTITNLDKIRGDMTSLSYR